MTVTAPDPFDLGVEEEVWPPRDRWSRPLLIPNGGTERQPYTRMSTLSGYLTDKSAVETWTRQRLAIGLAMRPDLCALIAALPPLHDITQDKRLLSKEQKQQDADTKAKLADYLQQAMEAGGCHFKANLGTAKHMFIERGVWDSAPERMIADVESAVRAFTEHGLEVLATERFVANDELGAAGSFDYLVRHPRYGCVIADVKGGQKDHGLEFGVQFSGYANGELYHRDDTRSPLESLTGGEEVNREVGLLLHVPLGHGKTDIYPVDLRRGRKAALLAVKVREERAYNQFVGPKLEAAK